MTFKEFLSEAFNFYSKNKDNLRLGQAYWCALSTHRKDLADKLQDTDLNTFYHDDRIDLLIEYLASNWKDSKRSVTKGSKK